MNLDEIKPLGAFVENTLRPFLAEFKEILDELKEAGINLENEDIIEYSKIIANLHLRTVFVQAVRDITIGVIIAFVLWKISV